ncbi:MAG: hypothetical protein GEU98_01280 [Pseudonocardiaceae bacterium]|nr:hypothetical protein [Pseudonocardiaceae bacterium]
MDRRKDGLPQLGQLGELIEKHVGKHLDSQVVGQVREKFEQWNDPAARLERRRRRASRLLTLWIVLIMVFGTLTALGFAGAVGGDEQSITLGSSAAALAAAIVAVLSVRTGLRLRRLNRTKPPARPAGPPPLPSRDSVAREPMERLAEAESSFAELVEQLAGAGQNGSLVPESSVLDARNTATDAASALRDLADRIQAIERAREAAPQRERAALGEAIRTLQGQLDSGLEGYGSLVAAAGRAVAESSGHLEQHQQQLTEATDHLAGLAIAVRELSAHNR